MPLTIENGSSVAGANSYVSVTEARAFAAARASTLPDDDAAVEGLLVQATDYLDTLAFVGTRRVATQPLAWPRSSVTLYGAALADDSIPPQLKNAQMQLAIDAVAGPLQESTDGRIVTKEQVDVIVTEYAEGSTGGQRVFRKALDFLAPLLSAVSASSGGVSTLRV